MEWKFFRIGFLLLNLLIFLYFKKFCRFHTVETVFSNSVNSNLSVYYNYLWYKIL